MQDQVPDFISQQSAETAPEVAEEGLSVVSKLAQHQLELQAEINDLEESLKQVKEKLTKVSTVLLPEAMEQYGMEEFKLTSGEKIKIDPVIGATISKANQTQAFKWLEDNGLSDIIKTAVTVELTHSEGEKIKELQNILNEKGFIIKTKTAVHASTLKATVKELIEKKASFPKPLFSVYEGKTAKIK